MKTMKSFQKLSLVILSIVLLVPGISQAASNQQVSMNSVVVSYADLDLSRDQNVVALYQRLQNAANKVCGASENRVGARITARKLERAAEVCAASALEQAIANIDNPRLTALHSQSQAPRVVSN